MADHVQLTMLNGMGGADFAQSLEAHLAWGLRTLDLKDSIFGKAITDLDDAEVSRVKELIAARGMSVWNLSTVLFHGVVEMGLQAWEGQYLARIPRTLEIARALEPRCIRLLACQSLRRAEIDDSTAYLREAHPWAIPMYRDAIRQVRQAGFQVLLENETGRCIWSRPGEVVSFFAALGADAGFMWDIQNMWECGTFPSLAEYEQLRPLIRQVHLKGGMSDTPGGRLLWRSSLEDASWPVRQIVRRILADDVSAVICLNPSHGQPKPGYDYTDVTRRDIEFLRREFPSIR